MAELIYEEAGGALGFGDHTLAEKTKLDGFEHGGDLYKIKTFTEITKLEKNGMLLFESVPGCTVTDFSERENGIVFTVQAEESVQITLGLSENKEYDIFAGGEQIGLMESNHSGKLSLRVESDGQPVPVKVIER